MKNKTITGSLQVKNGRFWAVLNLYDENHVRRPKWIDTGLKERGNKRNAEAFLADRLAEYSKRVIPYSRLTVAQYFTQWLDETKPPQVRPNTYRGYCGNMMNHIIPYFERHPILLQELTADDLETYYKSRLDRNAKLKTSTALSPASIKHHHQNISKALNDAVRKGLLQMNPASIARTPKAERFKGQFLNVEQLDELISLFHGQVIELPVMLCAVYGLRRSEALGLKWRRVDFTKRSITIAETLQQNSGGDYADAPKNDSSYRTLPMTEDVYQALDRQNSLQEEHRRVMGNYYIDSDYVCTWPDGTPITPNYLSRTFHSTICKSTLPQIRLHDLRHSAASNLLDMGFSVVQVADWLGHSSAATTLNFYAHVNKASKQQMADAIQQAFRVKKC